jgi:hypothetical protein
LFIDAPLADLKAQHCIDADRIFATAHTFMRMNV